MMVRMVQKQKKILSVYCSNNPFSSLYLYFVILYPLKNHLFTYSIGIYYIFTITMYNIQGV